MNVNPSLTGNLSHTLIYLFINTTYGSDNEELISVDLNSIIYIIKPIFLPTEIFTEK